MTCAEILRGFPAFFRREKGSTPKIEYRAGYLWSQYIFFDGSIQGMQYRQGDPAVLLLNFIPASSLIALQESLILEKTHSGSDQYFSRWWKIKQPGDTVQEGFTRPAVDQIGGGIRDSHLFPSSFYNELAKNDIQSPECDLPEKPLLTKAAILFNRALLPGLD
jgi:hypothetical protein